MILCIKLGKQCPTDADVGKWVAHAVDQGVRVLRFKLRWSVDPIILPKSLYTCETLVELTLSRKILVDFPPSSCLPSLKNLDLSYVVYKDEDSLLRFLSSCPVLEILYVKRNPDDNVVKFCVKVPSLWFLSYDKCTPLPDDGSSGRCLIMDTPGLTNLYITDNSGESFFIDKMPCLEVANIDVWSFPDTYDKLLRSLSGVRSLELDLTDEMALCCSTIKFSRLIKCKITPRDSDWMDSLVALLGNMPELKFLIVDYVE
ncbi:hypothetical protein Bca52824_003636 [Brassica carinata]|uniref:F-box/LRR-repeat protein 15/At3g58940/PEG3-like LRR domain-containing protein n=1 Tax=Brassica carinata TaxID=52824 RepID=A0A8X7WMG5_BRACI|nr:hypothetical protein Bca52824_003636 [Brassica carinata]